MRRSVLAITSELPWPLDSGGHLRSFHLLASLASRFDVRVVTAKGVTPGAVAAMESARIDVRAAAISAGRWTREAWRATESAARHEPYVMYRRHRHPEVARMIAEQIRTDRPDLVYLDHLDSLTFADDCDGLPLVADMHNVYSELLDRTARESFAGLRRLYLLREARLLQAAERRASCRVSGVLASSRADRDYFERLGAPAATLVPNGVDCPAFEQLPAGRSGPSPVILYVGTMSWEPNVQAAIYLARTVLPSVRALLPDCRLRIVGRDPTPAVLALAGDPHVEVTGRVPDMIPHLREAHVLAVPLEAGGGTRLKILEAFAAGLPVVSTPIGCEGIDADSGTHLLVAERSDFATALCALLQDTSMSAALAVHARALAQTHYDWTVVGALACRAVSEAFERAIVPAEGAA